MAKILIVEDDRSVSDMLESLLAGERHAVEVVASGLDAIELLKHYTYDLVVLDWNLPDAHGPDICRLYRQQGGSAPILMLTAMVRLEDKDVGFNAGADDYLTKPFHIREFLLRVKALLRRPANLAAGDLTVNNIRLDPNTHRVWRLDSQEEIFLLPREFALLEFLMRHRQQVFSAEALLDSIWRSDTDAGNEAVRSCVTRLRKKLSGKDASSIIVTVYGVGYKVE